MQNDNTTFCATSNGWRPIPTRLLESRGLYSPPRPVHNRRPVLESDARIEAQEKIRDAFRVIINDVINSSTMSIPEKVKQFEKLLVEMEADMEIIRNEKPTATTESLSARVQNLLESRQSSQTESTDNFIRRLKGRPATTPETRKSILTRLIGARAATQRLNESKKKGN